VPEGYCYILRPQEPAEFPSGIYHSEKRLTQALREFKRKRSLPQKATIHVYETGATPIGVGRKYVGCVKAGSVLMAGEVPIGRAKG
jgi:hypothetical protein